MMKRSQIITILISTILLLAFAAPAMAVELTEMDKEFLEVNIRDALVNYAGKYTARIDKSKEYYLVVTSEDLVDEIYNCLKAWGMPMPQLRVVASTNSNAGITPAPSRPKQNGNIAGKPSLIIGFVQDIANAVYAGEEILVDITIENIGDGPAANIKLAYVDEAGTMCADDEVIQIDSISEGETASRTLHIATGQDMQEGNHSYSIVLEYTDASNVKYSSSAMFSFTVLQIPSLICDPLALPSEISAGEKVSVPIVIHNTGKSTLCNVVITLTGKGIYSASGLFLEDIPSGGTKNGEIEVLAESLSTADKEIDEYFDTQVILTVSYQDIIGKSYSSTTEGNTKIRSAQNFTEGSDVVESHGQMWIAIIVGAIALAVVVLLLFMHRKKT